MPTERRGGGNSSICPLIAWCRCSPGRHLERCSGHGGTMPANPRVCGAGEVGAVSGSYGWVQSARSLTSLCTSLCTSRCHALPLADQQWHVQTHVCCQILPSLLPAAPTTPALSGDTTRSVLSCRVCGGPKCRTCRFPPEQVIATDA